MFDWLKGVSPFVFVFLFVMVISVVTVLSSNKIANKINKEKVSEYSLFIKIIGFIIAVVCFAIISLMIRG